MFNNPNPDQPDVLDSSIASLAAIVLVIGGIIVDQYLRWIGVLNCD